ncbi:MAG: hypothetical protein Tp138OMZ00d2C19078221_5 [Prokaryotic dsDNA virus sp.]|jgi:hypothetical protein|nr:hypothetical protein [Pseudomonadales bacterium]QDP67433.1 MAG: hypothetical protein Tp138OMZ00d2C19078221_5 [Prokaryotic dsDNA virus sp.]|tara:strand:+ start:33235 stop:33843 length:609 start_codon:yes stop_codon:yes gene_type:complete
MSFWQTSDGQSAQQQNGSFEMGGDALAPIPDGTSVLAVAEEAKNTDFDGSSYINIKWRISKPAEYGNRVIFQKVYVYTPEKADKAKKMLAAIASNAGGGLFSAMEQRGENMPSDMSLAQLCNRPMVLKLSTWTIDKDKAGNALPKEQHKHGNWVQAVSPAKSQAASPAKAPTPPPAPAPAADSFDDDIPFANPYRGVRALLV